MRILSLLVLAIFVSALTYSVDANANSKITKEMGEKYFGTCMSKKPQQKMTKKNQELLCACTAAKMMETMTTDDIRKMGGQDAKVARESLNHMIVNVYAPCMRYPATDHYYNTCISNPQTKTLAGDAGKLCGCMADKVANHLGKYGKEIFEDILRRNPNINDPMEALEADKEFQDYVGKQIIGCVL